jgi:uncharacterized protein YbjT (DUF2867 family)
MKVLVVGASGPTGIELVKQLSAHEVTVLSRSGPAGPGVVVGNAKDRADLERAVTGQDAVISALGSKKVGKDDLQTAFLTGVTAAMEAKGVKRLISLTPWGVGSSRASAPLLMKIAAATILVNQVADREAGERVVDASSLAYTHLRAGTLTNGPLMGGVVGTANGEGIGHSISRADVAAFMVAQLADEAWLRASVIIGYRR